MVIKQTWVGLALFVTGCSERVAALVNESWFALDSLGEDLPHLVVARLLREASDLAEQELLENQLSELVVLLVSFLCKKALCGGEVVNQGIKRHAGHVTLKDQYHKAL